MHKYNKKVLFPHFDGLKRDIGGNKYSLLPGELKYISILDMLRVSVIYYSNNCGKVVSTYLGPMQIEMCDAECIVSALGAFLHIINLT